MKRLLDYNPATGEKVWFEYSAHDDHMAITHEQDVSEALKVSHFLATERDYTREGMANDMWHYAKVPNSVILEMKQKFGVDFFDKNHAKRMFELLNTEYKAFKTTDRIHNVR